MRGTTLEQDFDLLTESIEQAGEIKRGVRQPSRIFQSSPLDVKEIRHKLRQSQREFAQMIGGSVATLQNWEQGRRKPEGPARALLQVAMQNPQAVKEALAVEVDATESV
jgi:putative transcriptional regulator